MRNEVTELAMLVLFSISGVRRFLTVYVITDVLMPPLETRKVNA